MNKITIITINFNDAIGLQNTMESVLYQSSSNFDYIVIDGGSQDESLEVIKSHQKKLHFWVSEKDRGIYNAMNKGVKQVKTEYVLFLNSGDTFYSKNVISHLEKLVSEASKDLIYGNLNILATTPYIKNYVDTFTFRYFLKESLPFPASLIKKSLIEKVGYFDENLKIIADWKFYLQIFSCFKIDYFHTQEVLVNFDLKGISSNSPDLIKFEKQKVLSEDFAFIWPDIKLGMDLEQKMKFLLQNKYFKLLKKYNLLKFLK
jgi:glycosyltransferase involved in cell wall biosynthesis